MDSDSDKSSIHKLKRVHSIRSLFRNLIFPGSRTSQDDEPAARVQSNIQSSADESEVGNTTLCELLCYSKPTPTELPTTDASNNEEEDDEKVLREIATQYLASKKTRVASPMSSLETSQLSMSAGSDSDYSPATKDAGRTGSGFRLMKLDREKLGGLRKILSSTLERSDLTQGRMEMIKHLHKIFEENTSTDKNSSAKERSKEKPAVTVRSSEPNLIGASSKEACAIKATGRLLRTGPMRPRFPQPQHPRIVADNKAKPAGDAMAIETVAGGGELEEESAARENSKTSLSRCHFAGGDTDVDQTSVIEGSTAKDVLEVEGHLELEKKECKQIEPARETSKAELPESSTKPSNSGILMDSESIADRQAQGHPAKSTDAPRGDNVNVIVDTCSSITLSRDDQDEDEKKHGILGVNEQGQYDSIADLESDGDDGDQVKVIRALRSADNLLSNSVSSNVSNWLHRTKASENVHADLVGSRKQICAQETDATLSTNYNHIQLELERALKEASRWEHHAKAAMTDLEALQEQHGVAMDKLRQLYSDCRDALYRNAHLEREKADLEREVAATLAEKEMLQAALTKLEEQIEAKATAIAETKQKAVTEISSVVAKACCEDLQTTFEHLLAVHLKSQGQLSRTELVQAIAQELSEGRKALARQVYDVIATECMKTRNLLSCDLAEIKKYTACSLEKKLESMQSTYSNNHEELLKQVQKELNKLRSSVKQHLKADIQEALDGALSGLSSQLRTELAHWVDASDASRERWQSDLDNWMRDCLDDVRKKTQALKEEFEDFMKSTSRRSKKEEAAIVKHELLLSEIKNAVKAKSFGRERDTSRLSQGQHQGCGDHGFMSIDALQSQNVLLSDGHTVNSRSSTRLGRSNKQQKATLHQQKSKQKVRFAVRVTEVSTGARQPQPDLKDGGSSYCDLHFKGSYSHLSTQEKLELLAQERQMLEVALKAELPKEFRI